jgi:DNA-binding transcriptional ArsR family regulator
MKHIDLDKPHKFFFETLGNQARWDIIHILQKSPRRVTDIADKLGLEQSLVSHHLKRLEICGFIKMKANGTERIYSLNEETIGSLLKLIDKHVNQFCKKVCCK